MSFSKPQLIAGGLCTYALAVFVGYKLTSKPEPPTDHEELSVAKQVTLVDTQRIASFNNHAKSYDSEIGRDEFFMGINLLRRWHLRKAAGPNLLEVGCGTGRNFDYYGAQVKRIVAVDAAEAMVAQSRAKLQTASAADRQRIDVRQMNAHQLAFDDDTFETVVDTFGLCSYDDPNRVLREMKRVCRKQNGGGRILLIEHGRGSYDWINNVLDRGACQHANNWGCIWNRNIIQLVEQAGLEVVSVSRFHFGTTYLIECKPDDNTIANKSSASVPS